MKTVKYLIYFSAFLMTVAAVVDIINLDDVENNPYKFFGAYIAVGAIAVLMIALIFFPLAERKNRKLQQKIEEKDQEIGRLQKTIEQTNEVISIVPNEKGEDVKM